MGDALTITTTSGRVHVLGEPRANVHVEHGGISDDHGRDAFRSRSDPVDIRVPAGTDLVVGTASGAVELEGRLGNVSVTTVSGDIRVGDVASIDARTKSGTLDVQASAGLVRLKSGSSSVHVHQAEGEVRVASVSGSVRVERSPGPYAVRTVSGSVDLAATGAQKVMVETVSGTVRISVPSGVHPSTRLASVSGARHIGCDAGDDVEIVARSVNGALSVVAEP